MNTAHSAGAPSVPAKAMNGTDTVPNGLIKEGLTGYAGNATRTSGTNLIGLLNKPDETPKNCLHFLCYSVIMQKAVAGVVQW